MNGWLDVSGSLHLCPNHTNFLSERNQTEEGMMKAGWIKLTNDKGGFNRWAGADLEYATQQQVATINRFHTIYGGSMPSIIRRKTLQSTPRLCISSKALGFHAKSQIK